VRSRLALRVALPLALALSLALPGVASAFSISGTITNANGGAPLENICVQADGQEGQQTGLAKSGPMGTYSMTTTFYGGGDPLAGGTYLVSFHNCSPFLGGTGDWAAYCCDQVTLDVDNPDATVDHAMVEGGYITGTVTGGGNPLNNICVQANPAVGFGLSVQANTAADGTYTLHNLAPGDMKIFFSACHGENWVTEYYDSKPDFASADPVTVNAGGASTPATVDVTMQEGATIQGTVTDAANPGTGIQNICVNVDQPEAGQFGLPVTLKGAFTAADGAYSVTGLPPGSYKVEFKDCFSGQGFLTKWFDGQDSFANADTVGPLAAGDTGTVDQALDKGSSIAGTVTGTGGVPLASVCVEAYDAGGSGSTAVAQTTTNGSGAYKLTPLVGGDYKIRFRDCAFHPSYVEEWFDDKSDFAGGNVVTVAPGEDLTGKDAQLVQGGHIAGRVTDGSNPIQNICIRATQDTAGPSPAFAIAYTASNGTFNIAGLPTGEYVIEVTDCYDVGEYIGEYWDDKTSSIAANRVGVIVGSTTDLPHDIVLAQGGAISGTVTDGGANPLAHICVSVVRNGDAVDSDTTGSDGKYTVGPVPVAADYKVRFSHCPSYPAPRIWLTQWFNGAPDASTATPVAVTAGNETQDIDATMQPGGHITGTVTDGADPVEGICVSASGTGENGSGTAKTGADGAYDISGLASGDYRVYFYDCRLMPAFAEQWWNDSTLGPGDPVSVTAPDTHGGIDAVMHPFASISGTVTNGSGPVEGACVYIYPFGEPDIASFWDYVETDADGNYTIGGLGPADWKIIFAACFYKSGVFPYQFEAYDDQLDAAQATKITLSAGQDLTGIDAVLANDVTPPDTSIAAAPSGTIHVTDAHFAYRSTEPLATFACSITKEGGSAQAVSCPAALADPFGNEVTVHNLADGTYTFSVAARDRAGNQDASPAAATFTVDAVPDTGGGGDDGGGGGTGTTTISTPPPATPPPVTTPAVAKCVVPKLVGLTLKKAKKALKKAHCRLGKVTKRKAKRVKGKKRPKRGTVVAQRPKPRTTRLAGSKIALVVAR
jgi:hypothetical protein